MSDPHEITDSECAESESDLLCYICTEPLQSPASLSQCHSACSSQYKACFTCLMWWFAHGSNPPRKDGEPYCCPRCKVPSRTMDIKGLPFEGALSQLEAKYAERAGARAAEEMDSLSADAIRALRGSEEFSAAGSAEQSEETQFDIHYIAGVHVVSSSVTKYKVVWHTRDLHPGDDSSSWVQLDSSVESYSKVSDFLKRWRLPVSRPVSFRWEHAVPERARNGQWKCSQAGCSYSTSEESNCRKHAGAVHCQSFFDCPECGEKCKTSSNLGKHRSRKHPAVVSAAAAAHGIAPVAAASADALNQMSDA